MSTCNYCEIEFDDDGTCEGCCCVPCAEAYEGEQVVNRLRARVAELEAENAELRGGKLSSLVGAIKRPEADSVSIISSMRDECDN